MIRRDVVAVAIPEVDLGVLRSHVDERLRDSTLWICASCVTTPFDSVTCRASVTPFNVLTFLTTFPSSRNFSISAGVRDGAPDAVTAVCAAAVHGPATSVSGPLRGCDALFSFDFSCLPTGLKTRRYALDVGNGDIRGNPPEP